MSIRVQPRFGLTLVNQGTSQGETFATFNLDTPEDRKVLGPFASYEQIKGKPSQPFVTLKAVEDKPLKFVNTGGHLGAIRLEFPVHKQSIADYVREKMLPLLAPTQRENVEEALEESEAHPMFDENA